MNSQFYAQKLRSVVFEPLFGRLRGNVHPSSIPWNAHCRLPIGNNRTLFASSYSWGTTSRNLSKLVHCLAGHFETKRQVER